MAAPPAIVHLKVGDSIDKFVVEKKLGEGAYGAVYQVRDTHKKTYALKTESNSVKLLRLELRVMKELKSRHAKHYCTLIDHGKKEHFRYVVMKIVGASLQEVKKLGPNQHMSTGCALSVSRQCLEAIRELHDAGFLHRDIKPGNFCVGRPEHNELRHVVILDFGLCKSLPKAIPTSGGGSSMYSTKTEERAKGAFRGTPRYAPLASHRLEEHARKDDLESWFYMLVDFCNASLPWKVTSALPEIGKIKESCRTNPGLGQMLTGVPEEMTPILAYIDSLPLSDRPDYEYIDATMKIALVVHNFQEYPYDWEHPKGGGAAPASKSFTRSAASDNP